MKEKKPKLYFIVGSIFVVVLLISLTFANKKGTYSIDNENLGITLTCPQKVTIGGEVTCTIGLTNTNNTILSVNANYVLPNELTYVSYDDLSTCDGGKCFTTLASTENGFAAINTNGITTSTQVGKLKLAVSSTATSNTNYTIKLTNIELCDNQYVMHTIEDVEINVRTANNDATLSNISINKSKISENFNSELKKYTATVADNVDNINLVITKSDEAASVSGIVENLNIHYGTNTYTISVTSEDGTVTNDYTIEIYRQYNFTTNVYTYNSTNNYLYTKNDVGNTIINNLEELPSNLSYNINNNKLEIKYLNSEILKSINIINFTTTYSILNNDIYVDNDTTTLSQFINGITSSTVTAKVFDNNNEITNTSTLIADSNTLKIYYNNTVIDTYNIKLIYLKLDSSLIIDSDKNIIKRLPLEMTFGELKSKINTSGTITLETDVTVGDNYKLRTGDKLNIQLRDETITYTISVLGCVDKNTTVEISDIIKIYRYMKGRIQLTPEEVAASDIINDGEIGLNDVIKLYLYFKNRINKLEVS